MGSSSQGFKDIYLRVFAISISETGWKKESGEEDEINVPITLSVFRDKGS